MRCRQCLLLVCLQSCLAWWRWPPAWCAKVLGLLHAIASVSGLDMANSVAQGLAASCCLTTQCACMACTKHCSLACSLVQVLQRGSCRLLSSPSGPCRFALGAAGKVASRALSELAKPPRTDSPAPRGSTSSSVTEQPTWDQGPTFRG